METMDDYKDELEASFRRINEGDIISGTVIDVNEEEVTLDLKYYAQGIIKVADLSNDPDFNVLEQVHKGDVIEATVVQKDDGAGNIVLSKKEANDILAWDKLKQMMEGETTVKVRIQRAYRAVLLLIWKVSVHLSRHRRSHLIMWKIPMRGSEKRSRYA